MINPLNSFIISKFESVESKDMALNQNKQKKKHASADTSNLIWKQINKYDLSAGG